MDVVDHFDLFDEEPIQKKGDDIIDMAIEVLNKSNRTQRSSTSTT